jgi:hypothetical protein
MNLTITAAATNNASASQNSQNPLSLIAGSDE